METSMRAHDSAAGDDFRPLPRREQLRTWAGHGTGATCSGCGQPVRASEIEYEVEMAEAGGVTTMHFHFGCYRDWASPAPR